MNDRIWFHGTDRKGYESIKKNGLEIGSYITPDLQAALTMGGEYIFMFIYREPNKNEWQARIKEPITEFVAIIKYTDEMLYYNENLWEQRHIQQHIAEHGNYCDKCNGHGELKYNTKDGHQVRISGSRFDNKNPYPHEVVVCDVCNGYGYLQPETIDKMFPAEQKDNK